MLNSKQITFSISIVAYVAWTSEEIQFEGGFFWGGGLKEVSIQEAGGVIKDCLLCCIFGIVGSRVD